MSKTNDENLELSLRYDAQGLIPAIIVDQIDNAVLMFAFMNAEAFAELFSRARSRSLTELTRQITPPTKNGHAPPPIESRKIFNLSILTMSGPGKFPRVESN